MRGGCHGDLHEKWGLEAHPWQEPQGVQPAWLCAARVVGPFCVLIRGSDRTSRRSCRKNMAPKPRTPGQIAANLAARAKAKEEEEEAAAARRGLRHALLAKNGQAQAVPFSQQNRCASGLYSNGTPCSFPNTNGTASATRDRADDEVVITSRACEQRMRPHNVILNP